MGQTITDVKLVKKGKSLAITVKEDGDCPATDDKTGNNACHPDLINALQKMAPHLAILSDFFPIKKPPKTEEDLKRFFVTGYSLGGKEGFEGITLKGYRTNIWGGITNLNPFILWESSPEHTYPLVEEIRTLQQNIEKEVLLYFKEAKRGDPELFGSAGSDKDEEGEEPAGGEGEGEQEGSASYQKDSQQQQGRGGRGGGARSRKKNKEQGNVKEMSAYPGIPPADKDAMERVRNGDAGETKEGGQIGKTNTA